MNSSAQLIYPTIDLFLYDLRSGLGDDEETIKGNRQRFWEKIYTPEDFKIHESVLIQRENSYSPFVDLLGSTRFKN